MGFVLRSTGQKLTALYSKFKDEVALDRILPAHIIHLGKNNPNPEYISIGIPFSQCEELRGTKQSIPTKTN